VQRVGQTAKAKRRTGQARINSDFRLMTLKENAMSTKINIAAVAAFLTLAAAPQLASAQQAIFLPSTQWNTSQTVNRQLLNVPSNARAQAGSVRHHRAGSVGTYQVPASEQRPSSNNLNPDFQLGGDR